MAGTIFGLPLSQQLTITGVPMSGARLYLYLASTTTPAVAYQDFGLTVGLEMPWPIEADASGRIPQFWLTDGSYRARLTDSAGTVQFDLPFVQALGPSTGTGGGGGTVDATAVFQTGDTLWVPRSGTRSGWVRHNARTIGSATSGASERANSDCEALFTYLWQGYADALCPVSGGRGANAAADWAANKPIATLNLLNKGPLGLPDMGNTDSGALNGVTFSVGTKTTPGAQGGEVTHTLSTAEMPVHDFDVTSTGTLDHKAVASAATASFNAVGGGAFGMFQATQFEAIGTVSVTGTTNSIGSGTAHNNMHPFALGTWYVKL